MAKYVGSEYNHTNFSFNKKRFKQINQPDATISPVYY
jgi:hypothetical protein